MAWRAAVDCDVILGGDKAGVKIATAINRAIFLQTFRAFFHLELCSSSSLRAVLSQAFFFFPFSCSI